MENSVLSEIFSKYHEYLDEEQNIREAVRNQVRDMEQTAREATARFQLIHQDSSESSVADVCRRTSELLPLVQTQYTTLAQLIPANQYYRYHGHWRFVSQRWMFLLALSEYLQHERLVTHEQAAAMLTLKAGEGGFFIDLEDYLSGLLLLASELARFAVNSVTAGCYERPCRVSAFLSRLDAGFKLLNLKNDSLRRQFDALKYDLKKVEEVVYELSIRGLTGSTSERQASGVIQSSAS